MTAADLKAFRDGAMRGDDVVWTARHLVICPECALAASRFADPSAAAAEIAAAITAEERPAHLDPDQELFPLVDGTLPGDAREAVERHLESCSRCRGDFDDLLQLRVVSRSRSGAETWAIAASVVVLLLAVYRFWPVRQTPATAVRPSPAVRVGVQPTRATYGRPEWDQLVSAARRAGQLAPPIEFEELQEAREPVRGVPTQGHDEVLSPTAVIVENDRPTFQWSRIPGATSYKVGIFESERNVFSSEALTATSWTPPRPLQRGSRYEWQLTVLLADGSTRIVPSPPVPPATFRVLNAAAAADIAAAQRQFPSDSLLLATLYAHYGLREEARRALAAGPLPGSDAGLSGRLRASLEAWSHPSP